MRRAAWGLVFALGVVGCSGETGDVAEKAAPEDPGPAPCALCAMVVREQPASRGQVLHRDGERAFLCSVSELPHYASAPSPHGKPRAVWVEALRPEDGPATRSTEAHSWVLVGSAHFVVGGPPRPVMGESVLVYATREAAEDVAAECGGRVLDWPALEQHLRGAAP